jgi:hypothetical protein
LEITFLKNLFKSILILSMLMTGSANAAFVNAYKVSNWTKSINGGVIKTIGTNSVALTSSNNGGGAKNQDFTIKAVADGIVKFSWNYTTKDVDGSTYDPFGWLLRGIFTKLTVNGSKATQSGVFSFAVKKGDIFGFRQNSVDSILGSAITTISNFNVSAPAPAPSAVPVPAAVWLMVAPLMGLLGRKRNAAA